MAPPPPPKQLTYGDLLPYTDKMLAEIPPPDFSWAERQNPGFKAPKQTTGEYIDARLREMEAERPKVLGGQDRAMGIRKQLVDYLTAGSGMSTAQADRLLMLRSNALQGPDEPIKNPSSGGLDLFPGEIAPGDYATDAEYQAAVMQKLGLNPQSRTEITAEQTAADQAAQADAAKKQDIRGQLQAFVDSMTGPSAPNDPTRLALIQAGTDAAQASAGRAGVRGSLASTQAASMAQQNLVPYEAQRSQMRGQALQTLGNYDLGASQLQAGIDQANQARQDMIAQERWKAQQNAVGPLRTLMTIGGGVAGAYFGGPQGAIAGASLGNTTGGMLESGSKPAAPAYTTYSKPKGSLGGIS